MTAAAVYTRISRDVADDGLGVARQERECRELATARGWDVVAVFSDNDISAFTRRRRPGYEALLEAVKAGTVGAIVAWHPDRLHRSPAELEAFIDAVEAAGVLVATVQAGTLDLSTAAGRMTARVVGAVARHESEHKAERQRSKAAELAAAGKVGGGGMRPFGFEADRVTVRAGEAAVVVSMVADLAAGASLRSVADRLNRAGVATVTGKPWRSQTVRSIVLSARIVGMRSHRGVTSEAVWPAIVDRDLWEAAQLVLLDPARRTSRPSRRYLLTGGISRCGRCGEPLRGRARLTKTPGYICAAPPDFDGCGRLAIRAEALDEYVVGEVFEWVDRLPLAAKATAATAPEVDEVAILEARRARAALRWADGIIDDGSWDTARNRIDERLRTLRAVDPAEIRTRTLDGFAGQPGMLAALWPGMDLDRRQIVLRAALDAVIVHPAVRGRNWFDPGRVEFRKREP